MTDSKTSCKTCIAEEIHTVPHHLEFRSKTRRPSSLRVLQNIIQFPWFYKKYFLCLPWLNHIRVGVGVVTTPLEQKKEFVDDGVRDGTSELEHSFFHKYLVRGFPFRNFHWVCFVCKHACLRGPPHTQLREARNIMFSSDTTNANSSQSQSVPYR